MKIQGIVRKVQIQRCSRVYSTAKSSKYIVTSEPSIEKSVYGELTGKTADPKRRLQSQSANGNGENLAETLYETYNSGYAKVPKSTLGSINSFFNKAKVTYEWSASTFMEIPGEQLKQQLAKNVADGEFEDSNRVSSLNSDQHRPTRKYPGKTSGIPFELLNGLPEVAFLGRCNAGKSTLLNNLTTEFSNNKLTEYAKASKKAGFTKTINCFNIGKRLRIVDTPGYGVKSTPEQGELTMKYLRERKELKRSFLLISAEQGFTSTDAQLVEFMTTFGIPFEIVFTKLDKIKNIDNLHAIIQESGVLALPTLPQMLFLNSVTNKTLKKRYGIDRLRGAILESCGLQPDVKPSRVKTK